MKHRTPSPVSVPFTGIGGPTNDRRAQRGRPETPSAGDRFRFLPLVGAARIIRAVRRAGALSCLGLGLVFLHVGSEDAAAQYRADLKEYDEQGRLVAAADERGELWRFVYDPDGSRRVWFGGREVALEKTDGTVEAYAYGAHGRRVQTRITGKGAAPRYIPHQPRRRLSMPAPSLAPKPAAPAGHGRGRDPSGTVYSRDELGRLTSVTNAKGTTHYRYFEGVAEPLIAAVTHPGGSTERFDPQAARAAYEALATSARASPASGMAPEGLCAAPGNRFAFGGYRYECELGLYLTPSGRMYDPEVGRFTIQDSYLGQMDDPPSLHRYLYANANPALYVDPTGHWSWKGFFKGAGNLAAEPFRIGADIVIAGGSRLMDIDEKDVALTSMLGRAQQGRVREGKSLLRTSLEGSRDVTVGVFSFGIVPAAQQHYDLAKAYRENRITIDQYDEALSELAGGQFAAAGLASAGAKSGGQTWRGRAAPVADDPLVNVTPGAQALANLTRDVPEGSYGAGNDLPPRPGALPLAAFSAPEGTVVEGRTGPFFEPMASGSGTRGTASGYEPLRPHPTDPNVPGGAANYRGRYNAALDAEGQSRLPADWDVHHSVPQQLRGDPRLQGIDIDAPSQMRGVPGYRQPGAQTNVHSLMDQEWRQFQRSNPNATRQELLNFRDYQDWRFQHTFWESQARPKP